MGPIKASTPLTVKPTQTERSVRAFRRALTSAKTPVARKLKLNSKKNHTIVTESHGPSQAPHDISNRIAQRVAEVRAGASLTNGKDMTIVDKVVEKILAGENVDGGTVISDNERDDEGEVEGSSSDFSCSDIVSGADEETPEEQREAESESVPVMATKQALPTWRLTMSRLLKMQKSTLIPEQVVTDPCQLDKKISPRAYKILSKTRNELKLAIFLQHYCKSVDEKKEKARLIKSLNNEKSRNAARTRCEEITRKTKKSISKTLETGRNKTRSDDSQVSNLTRSNKRKNSGALCGPSKFSRLHDDDEDDDNSGWESFAQHQRMVSWKFKEFAPSGNKAYIPAEFAEYMEEFRSSAKLYGIDKRQQLTRLHDDSGKAITQALAVIKSDRGPFTSVDELAEALMAHWRDTIDELTCENEFKSQKRKKGELFMDYLYRLLADVNKLPTVVSAERKFIKIEELILNTVALSAEDDHVQMKARTLYNERPQPMVEKTNRLASLKKLLKNRDAHEAARQAKPDEADTIEDDIIAKVDKPKGQFSFSGRDAGRKFVFQGNKDRTNGPRFVSKKQFVNESEARTLCQKCNKYHFKGPCRCATCSFHHDPTAPCMRCNGCQKIGHKRKTCPVPQSEWPKQNSMTTNSFAPNAEVKAVTDKDGETNKSNEADKVMLIDNTFEFD